MAVNNDAMITSTDRSLVVLLDKYMKPVVATVTTSGAVLVSMLIVKTLGMIVVSGLAFGVGCWLAKRFTTWLDRKLLEQEIRVLAQHSTTQKPRNPTSPTM